RRHLLFHPIQLFQSYLRRLPIGYCRCQILEELSSDPALSKIWSLRPMSLSIVEILEKKGPMTDIYLLKDLRSNFGEVSFRQLNRELMKLELADSAGLKTHEG